MQRLFSAAGTSSPSTPSDYTHLPSTPHRMSFNVTSQADQSDQFEDSDAGTWVTVFGFPPNAASYVLTQTGMWGHILEHRIPSQVIFSLSFLVQLSNILIFYLFKGQLDAFKVC